MSRGEEEGQWCYDYGEKQKSSTKYPAKTWDNPRTKVDQNSFTNLHSGTIRKVNPRCSSRKGASQARFRRGRTGGDREKGMRENEMEKTA